MKTNKWWRILRPCIACVLFLLLFLTILFHVERLIMEPNCEFAIVADYVIPSYSADVIVFGASHVTSAIISQKLMDDQGIASVNAANANQLLWQSVYKLERLLQSQKPRVVVMTLNTVTTQPRSLTNDPESDSFDEMYYSFIGVVPRVMPWINPLKYSISIRQAMLDPYSLPYLSTIGMRHSSIWSLSRNDFLKARRQTLTAATLNYYQSAGISGQTLNESLVSDQSAVLPEFCYAQLSRMIELCKENNAELLLIGLPWSTTNEWLGMAEKACVFAETQGAAYLSMDAIICETDFDYATDMADPGHLNYNGAIKVTGFLGQFLKENYNLPDRREDPDPRYDVWKARPYQYVSYAAGEYIRYVKEFDEWVCEAEYLNEDYLLIFATNITHGSGFSENLNWDIVSFLNMLGFEEAETFADDECGWFAIMEGTKVLLEQTVYGNLNYATIVDGRPLTLRATQGKDLIIKLDNEQINCGDVGLNIILYDKVKCRVIVKTCLNLIQEGITLGH